MVIILEIQALWVWNVVVCHWAHGTVHYEEMYCLHLWWFSWLLDPEDEGTTFLWNVRNHPPNNNVSHSWRPESSGRSGDDNLLTHNATPSETQCHTWYTVPHLLIHNATPSETQCHTWYTVPHLLIHSATPSDTRYLNPELETSAFLCPSWQGWESPATF